MTFNDFDEDVRRFSFDDCEFVNEALHSECIENANEDLQIMKNEVFKSGFEKKTSLSG